jgi:hypothetical protein
MKCPECGSDSFLIPLHCGKGGPLRCPLCVGQWNAEHGRRRRTGRVVIRAIKAFLDAGGKYNDIDTLKLSAIGDGLGDSFGPSYTDPLGYMDGIAKLDGGDIDLTSELLADLLRLAHPDHHPVERKALATQVTQGLLALQPFVFPATKKPPLEKTPPRRDPQPEMKTETLNSPPSRNEQRYPCADCADAVPFDYCDACKAEYEKREQQEFEQRTKKQRRAYKRRRERALGKRQKRQCKTCGMQFRIARTDARYCSDTCRQRAHRETRALVTDKQTSTRERTFIRYKSLENRILKLLKKHPAIFLNDVLPRKRTRAEYQALCLAAVKLEDEGKIESFSYYWRSGKPGHKALCRPGHEIKDSDDIPRLIKRPKPRPPEIRVRGISIRVV